MLSFAAAADDFLAQATVLRTEILQRRLRQKSVRMIISDVSQYVSVSIALVADWTGLLSRSNSCRLLRRHSTSSPPAEAKKATLYE